MPVARRDVFVLVLATLCVAAGRAQEQPAAPPNVLLIISDDQHWSDFGFLGESPVQTPALDRLAASGLVFPRGYVTAPLCRPSLATLATGLHPHQHGITGNDPPAGTPREQMLSRIDACATLPALLSAAGYLCLQTGKWWEGAPARAGFDLGMTHGDPARGGRHGDLGLKIGREGLEIATSFMTTCAAKAQPWFLWYAPFLPHTPHNPPAELLAQYQQEGVPLPVAKYRAMCAWFDQTVGELLDCLEASGQRENTLVVLVTDNGWIQREAGNGYAPRSKRTAYEGGVRTPIVLSWPGVIAPQRASFPVSSVDLPPTILAACGLTPPAAWPGVDLRACVGAGAKARGPVFGAAYQHDVVSLAQPTAGLVTRFVVDGRWKLLVSADPELAPELYDLLADPAEEHPVRDAARVARLRALLDAWWTPNPPAFGVDGSAPVAEPGGDR